MNRKHYWVLAILILIIGVVGVYFTLQPEPEPEKGYILPSKADNKESKETDQPIAENNQPTRVAKEGFTWEQHGDHFHEVPIDVSNESNDEPVTQPEIVTSYTGPLTFHAELLETNPVEALRLQAEERGHINAKWIPPFPPDDIEAQELAKAVYAFIYNTNSDPPKLGIGGNDVLMMREIDKKYPVTSARNNDLSRLTWVSLDFSMGEYNLPSDYFPPDIEVK